MIEPKGFQRVRFSPRTKTILTVLIVLGVFAFLYGVRGILGPFFWGLITAYLVTPVVRWVEHKTHLGRVWIVSILYITSFALIGWAVAVLVPLLVEQLVDLAGDIPAIVSSLQEDLDAVGRFILGQPITFYGVHLDPQVLVDEAVHNLQNIASFLTRQALPALVGAVGAIIWLVVYFTSTFYFFMESGRLFRVVPKLFPRPYRPEIWQLMRRINRVLGKYVRGQVLLVLLMSAAVFVVLTILRVKYSLILAFLTGVLEVIPVIGPMISTIVVALIALVQPVTPFGWSNLTLVFVIIVIYVILRQIEDNIVIPAIMGRIINLHPLLVLFALFSGQALAGVSGLLLAIPAAAALRLIAEYVYQKLVEPDVPIGMGHWSEQEARPVLSHASESEDEEGN